jgi:hypothetical protein
MSEDTSRLQRPSDEPAAPEPAPDAGAGPVGRVNLRAPVANGPQTLAAPPPTGWTVRNIIIGVLALVVIIGGLILILQGAFQLTPA